MIQSTIIDRVRRVAEAIRAAGLGSRTAAWIRRASRYTETALNGGVLAPLADDGFDRRAPLYRLRRAGMRVRESSRMLGALKRTRSALLDTRVGDFGLFFLLTGILFLILTLLIPAYTGLRHRGSAAVLILISLPLLPSGKPLSHVLRHSRAVGLLLFGLCRLPRDRLESRRTPSEHSVAVLAASALSVALAALISPFWWCLTALGMTVAALLFSFPELTLPIIALLFPLLPLLPAPTVITCVLAVTVWLSYLSKALCGRRSLTVDTADVPVFLLTLAFFLGAFIGFGDPADGIAHALLVSLYFPARNLLSTPRLRRYFCTALLFGAFFCASYGIVQYFFSDATARWLDVERFSDISRRVTGSFSNPNVLAVYLLLCFPFALCGTFDRTQTRIRRAFFAITACAIALCTVLTWTRGAWLGLLLQLVLFVLFYSRGALTVGLIASPFAACAIAYLPHSILNRFSSIGTLAESSIRYRLHTWQGVLRLIGAHPWGIGVGEHAFCALYPRYALPGIESVMHAHNVYLQLTLELGLVGLILFLAPIAVALLRALRRTSHSGAALALVGVLCMGAFDHLWYFRPLAALLFTVLALGT